MPVALLQFVIMTLAVARLTRIIVDDSISIPFRNWIEYKEAGKDGHVPIISLTTLVNCSWCAGFWMAVLVAGSTALWGNGDWLWWIWLGLAASYLVGMIEDKLGSDR